MTGTKSAAARALRLVVPPGAVLARAVLGLVVLVGVVLVGVVLGGPPAWALTLADAKTGFSADRLLVIDGKSYEGRMWTMPGMERHEQNLNGIPAAFVLHRDTPIADLVLPELHTVVQFVLPPELHLFADPRLTRKPIGSDTVNGVATTKYAIDETVPEGHGVGTLWLSSDGIPMKAEGTFTRTSGRVAHIRWELSHVRMGPQPAALFVPPHDFSKLPAAALTPLLGLKVQSPH